MTSTVSVRGQTAIPVAIRKRYGITSQTRLEWVDDGHGISIIPVPKDTVKSLKGRFKGVDLMGSLLKMRQEERRDVREGK
jgi:bifunctional DNA-binding transcriptional regulator/antitoxin component of YhaV-PrlF toxin-antitoxin module